VVRSRKFKRKPFNSNLAGRWVIIAPLAFSYPRVSSDRVAVSATHKAVGMTLSDPRVGTSSDAVGELLCNGGLLDIDAKLEKLAMNRWCAPQ
jgi:hypothetical protein